MRRTDGVIMKRGSLLVGAIAVALLSGCASPGPMTATVTAAGLSQTEPGYMVATGSVSGISETGGECSFTFWAETGVATRLRGTGTADGDHTTCGPVDEPLGFMVGVNYEVELKYQSLAGATIVSERVPMVLPRPSVSP